MRLAFDLHGTARPAGKAVNLRKPEAGTLANILGGEERLEAARDSLRIHSLAGIRPRYLDKITHELKFTDVGPVSGSDGDGAALGHRIARIHAEIQQRGFKLSRINPHRPNIGIEGGRNRDITAQGPVEQLPHPLDVTGNGDGRRMQLFLPRKGEQLARERGASFGGLAHSVTQFLAPFRRRIAVENAQSSDYDHQ